MKNPFVFGHVVTGADYLKRPEIEAFIEKSIDDGQNLFIVGQRRTGKTSTVINTLQSVLKRSYIHADFFGVRTRADVVKKLVIAVAKFREENFGLQDALKALTKFRVKAQFKSDGSGFDIKPYLKEEEYTEEIVSCLDHIKELSKHKKFAVFFDEFQELLKVEDSASLLGEMRSVIQFINKTPFIFTGSARSKMDNIFRDPVSPFYKSALPLEFPKIEMEDLFNFVNAKMKKKKIHFEKKEFETLYSITEGIVGDIQQFCKIAFGFLEEGSFLNETAFNKILAEVFKQEDKFYNYTVYESVLTKLQVDILFNLAKHPELGYQAAEFKKLINNTNSNAISTALKALEKSSLIFKEGKSYHFFNPFFKEWLKILNI